MSAHEGGEGIPQDGKAQGVTTIVYRDGILASDSGVFDRGVLVARTPDKIWRNPDGSLAGFTGCFGDLAKFREWMQGGCEGDAPDMQDDCEGLQIMPDGTVYWYGDKARKIRQDGPFFPIGAGFRIAIGALHMGATAEQAVQICCDLDDSTAGPVYTLELEAEA